MIVGAQLLSLREPPVAGLYRAHFGYVWQVLRKLGVDEPGIEDAVHDVFMVVHRRFREFEHRSTARTWLFAIARRIAWRHRRTRDRTERRRAALQVVVPPEPLGPDDILARREAWSLLLRFLDSLDPKHRDAFVLGEIEGANRRVMGRLLRVSPNTAYSRLQAARRRFAAAFPDPSLRRAVAAASSEPAPVAGKRVHALVLASVSAGRSSLLGTFAAAASCAAAAVVLGVAALAPAAQSEPAVAQQAPPAAPQATAPVAAATPLVKPPIAELAVVESPAVPLQPPTPKRARPRAAAPYVPDPARAAVPAPVERVASTSKRPALPELAPAMHHLAQARAALRGGKPRAALDLLQRSAAKDPGGAFAVDRAVTRIFALCNTGQAGRARREAETLRRRGAATAYREVLSTSCVANVISSAAPGDQDG